MQIHAYHSHLRWELQKHESVYTQAPTSAAKEHSSGKLDWDHTYLDMELIRPGLFLDVLFSAG